MPPKAPGNPIRNPHPNRLIAIIYINFSLKTIWGKPPGVLPPFIIIFYDLAGG
jgi:hypothetical protein